MPEKDLESELLMLVELATAEAADEGQLRRLGQLLKQDESLRNLYAEACLLEVELRRVMQLPANSVRLSAYSAGKTWLFPLTGAFGAPWSALAASLLIVVAAIGFLAGRMIGDDDGGAHFAMDSSKDDGDATAPIPPAAHAAGVSVKLTKATQCVWGRTYGRNNHFPSAGMQGGERLELLEGFATFLVCSDDWQADIQIEGPAAIVMTSEGLPELQHGKMLVKASLSNRDQLSVGLPYAKACLLPGSEVGIGAFGGACEVHVFAGAASLKGLWGVDQPRSKSPDGAHVVFEGASSQLAVADDGSLSLRDGKANRGMFDAATTIIGGEPIITKDYVEKVMAANPIAYWRFEDPADNLVLNTAQDRFHLDIHGSVRFDGLTGNRRLSFPMNVGADRPRFLATKEPISAELPGDYSVEFWVNPTHYHTATIMAFVVPELKGEEPPQTWAADPVSRHGMLVELGGFSGIQGIMRPRKIRFVHRSEAFHHGGGMAFSDHTYAVREWQHMVFSKVGNTISIYQNGKKYGESSAPTGLPVDLIAVIGQISDGRFERPFYGRLDEMAIYNHPLTETQIREHYEAVQFIGESSGKLKSPPFHDIH